MTLCACVFVWQAASHIFCFHSTWKTVLLWSSVSIKRPWNQCNLLHCPNCKHMCACVYAPVCHNSLFYSEDHNYWFEQGERHGEENETSEEDSETKRETGRETSGLCLALFKCQPSNNRLKQKWNAPTPQLLTHTLFSNNIFSADNYLHSLSSPVSSSIPHFLSICLSHY